MCKRSRLGIFLASLTAIACLQALSTEAATVIWVDPSGTDSATCGASATPCKTLQQGVDRASPGDTVFLDAPVDYGPAVINKELSLQGSRGAGIFSGTNAPCIKVIAPFAVVRIRELICDRTGSTQHGIVYDAALHLELYEVIIQNGAGSVCGLLVRPSETVSEGVASFTADNVSISGFAGAGGAGICVTPGVGSRAYGRVYRSDIQSNRTGIRTSAIANRAAANVTIVASRVTSNSGAGISSDGANSIVSLSATTVSLNQIGLSKVSGGVINSCGGNSIVNNVTDGGFNGPAACN